MSQETTLQSLFIDELRDVYHAEKQLVKALPKMAKAASSSDLQAALESHLEETREHVERIERAFGLLDEPVKAKPCAGMAGIIEEGSDMIGGEDKGPALDAGIIAGGQRAEHYEMAAYGSLIAWANTLGHEDVAALLSETLAEEKAADAKLSELAEGGINAAAAEGADMDEDEEPAAPRKAASHASGRSASSRK
jgi:ferritin-like metal-binding protein YciE